MCSPILSNIFSYYIALDSHMSLIQNVPGCHSRPKPSINGGHKTWDAVWGLHFNYEPIRAQSNDHVIQSSANRCLLT